ncbi:kinase-like domain-containing protein [Mycena rosella]|uniref:Kinase-like domain-containing protein n=1 Tax=Mycena rosella TaxID=1033263 RepID=A0AAD7DLP8_MYCRO|nr:kinase-like domain-containing protein [Mycena rosella]
MAPTPSAPPAAKAKGMPSQKFIGAVEDQWDLFSDRFADYTVGAPIGFGASSIVYAAEYQPQSDAAKPIPCALKVLDLDSLPPHSLALLQRETTLMSLSKHPNVLRVRGSWMDGHKLYIALRLMNRGSAADVMRYGWPGGMEEDVVRCILQQALQGLNYLHVNGFIHRDVKAANLLIDDDGTVLLGDLGVAADLTEDTSRHPGSSTQQTKPRIITAEAALRSQRSSSSGSSTGHGAKRISFEPPASATRPKMGKRKSFVGTVAVLDGSRGHSSRQYDSSADIWSFGITALELTQGRPPRSRETPQRVLIKTIQEAPPSLDRDRGTFKYSRAFKEIVDSCLVKDPSKRPTAEELLQSPFFKGSKKKSYLVGAILRTAGRARRLGPRYRRLWDFATTLNSPTGTVRRTMLEQLASEDTDGAVFEMDGDEQGASRRRSKAISWAEVAEPEEVEQTDAPSSPSASSPSDQESPDALGSGSSVSSPPSPLPTSLEKDVVITEILLPPPSAPLSASSALRVPVPASEPLAVPVSSSLASSLSQSPLSTGHLSSSVSSSKSSPGLWKKIKGATGLRRPSSSQNVKRD